MFCLHTFTQVIEIRELIYQHELYIRFLKVLNKAMLPTINSIDFRIVC